MTNGSSLTVYSSASPRAALVLGHGAGAGQKSPFMVRVARGLAARGITTATFDFPYMAERRKLPDKPPVLEGCWRQVIADARTQFGALPLFIGGKSMGGRIASQVAAQDASAIRGLIFLGYPLHPPGKPQQRRDAHLPQITVPMLFVQGSRDTFGTTAEISALLQSLRRASLHAVEGGDHSLKIPATRSRKPDEVLDKVMDAVVVWVTETLNS